MCTRHAAEQFGAAHGGSGRRANGSAAWQLVSVVGRRFSRYGKSNCSVPFAVRWQAQIDETDRVERPALAVLTHSAQLGP